MASSARLLTHTLPYSSSCFFSARSASCPVSRASARLFTRPARRSYSTVPPPKSSKAGFIAGASLLAVVTGVSFYHFDTTRIANPSPQLAKGTRSTIFKPTKEDYQTVYDAIAKQLWEKDDYDDGSYGPVVLRLAWHASGTYDKETGTGGSNGATMRFAPEGGHGANSGLKNARDFLEPIKGNQDLRQWQ